MILCLQSLYVEWLQKTVSELKEGPNSPSDEKNKHYDRQVAFLKSVLDANRCEKVLESSTVSQLIPHGLATINGDVVTQQIHQRAEANTTNKLRKELFGLDTQGELRNRRAAESLLGEDFDDSMRYEEQRREKLVDDMVAMTREWKEQSRVAGKVIKKDIEVLQNSTRIADTNEGQLKVESSRYGNVY